MWPLGKYSAVAEEHPVLINPPHVKPVTVAQADLFFTFSLILFIPIIFPRSGFLVLSPRSRAASRRTSATCLQSWTQNNPPRPSSTSSTKSCCRRAGRWRRRASSLTTRSHLLNGVYRLSAGGGKNHQSGTRRNDTPP